MSSQWRAPESVAAVSIALGFFLWGPEGEPWAVHFGRVLGVDSVTHWELCFVWGAWWMVAVPLLLMRFLSDERDWRGLGLGLGNWRVGVPVTVALTLLGALVMWKLTATSAAMRDEYPLFGRETPIGIAAFVGYELTYVLFFAAGEVGLRGLLLFSVYRRSQNAVLAVALTTIPQILWHLGKPLPELLSAPLWGLLVGTLSLRLGSVWYMLVFHWLANVWLDVVIYFDL